MICIISVSSVKCQLNNLLGEDGLPSKIQTEPCPTPLNSLANILFTSTFRKTGVYILKARDAQIVKKIQVFPMFWDYLKVLIVTADPNQMVF